MKANHIPRADRLRHRILKLVVRYEQSRATTRGNPYVKCRGCDIRDPELSVQGHHRGRCPFQGLDRQIAHYQKLLDAELGSEKST